MLSGEFTVVNQHLLRDLMARDAEIRNQIIAHNGSVQNIPEVPDDLKLLYRTSWEIKQRALITAADRGHRPEPVLQRLCPGPQLWQALIGAFLRLEEGTQDRHVLSPPKPAADAIKFTVDQSTKKKATADEASAQHERRCTTSECLSCGA